MVQFNFPANYQYRDDIIAGLTVERLPFPKAGICLVGWLTAHLWPLRLSFSIGGLRIVRDVKLFEPWPGLGYFHFCLYYPCSFRHSFYSRIHHRHYPWFNDWSYTMFGWVIAMESLIIFKSVVSGFVQAAAVVIMVSRFPPHFSWKFRNS